MSDPFSKEPNTPGLDSNPHNDMAPFVRETFARRNAEKTSERASPQQKRGVERDFTSSPMTEAKSTPPKGPHHRQQSSAVFAGNLPPLTPRIIRDGDDYLVTLTHGLVSERVPGEGDALISQEILGIRLGSDAGPGENENDLKQHGITVGQQISVVVYVTPTGLLGPEEDLDTGDDYNWCANIAIEDENTVSVHYAPPCGDDTVGAPGSYHYKIAVFRDEDDTHTGPWLDLYLAGSHISHFRDLPLIDNYSMGGAADLGRVVGEYDFPSNKYLFRATSAQYGISSIENATTIDFSFDASNAGQGISGTPAEDGFAILMLPEGEPPYPNQTAEFRSLRALSSTDPDPGTGPQINLSYATGPESEEGADDNILIRGNSVIGENDAVVVEDGLVTVVKDFTSGGGGSGANLNLIVRAWEEDTGTGVIGGGSIEATHYWRNGLYVGNVDPGGAPVALITQEVSKITPAS